MKPLLVVIDMQRDFITGTLGTPEAQAIVPAVCQRIQAFPGDIVYTRDTHDENYLSTQEGKHLPVAHCLRGTPGWEILPEILAASAGKPLRSWTNPPLPLPHWWISPQQGAMMPLSWWACAPTFV